MAFTRKYLTFDYDSDVKSYLQIYFPDKDNIEFVGVLKWQW